MVGQRRFLVFLLSMAFCLPPTDSAPAQDSDQTADAAADAANEPAGESAGESAESKSLASPRKAINTFVIAMETQDYRTAITALDFSTVDPPPDQLQQVKFVQRLKASMDRIALVDSQQFSDAAEGPPVRFPPGSETSEIIVQRGEDGKWRFAATTVADIDSIYAVVADRPVIGAIPPAAETAPTAAEETAPAEQSADTTEANEEPVDNSAVPEDLRSARKTMHALFESLENRNYELAVAALDFTELEKQEPKLGPYARIEKARHLQAIIDRLDVVNYALISDDPNGPAFRFPPEQPNQPIVISRDEAGYWQFSAQTVMRIDALYEFYADKPIKNLPEEQRPWFERELVLGNETWRIMSLFAALFVSLVIGQTVKAVATWRAKYLESHGNRFRATFMRTVAASSVGVLFLIGLSIGMSTLVLEHRIEKFVSVSLHVVFSVVIGYVLFRLVDVAVGMLDELAKRSGSTLNSMLSPIVSTSMRLTIIVLVLLEIATAISDQPPSALLAGLGAGGLAIGLAAQETIKNLFGSVMIFADRPFEIGDRICVDGHDGPVERVGFRSTRIRTLDGHLVTVPNGEMANRTIHNIGKRPYIRRIMNIRISYETPPEKVREALSILRELLGEAEYTTDDHPPRVFLDDFLETAINVKAIYWFHPADYWAYCDYGEQLNLQIMERFRAAGIRFALPSQRLFLAGDPESPPDTLPFGS